MLRRTRGPWPRVHSHCTLPLLLLQVVMSKGFTVSPCGRAPGSALQQGSVPPLPLCETEIGILWGLAAWDTHFGGNALSQALLSDGKVETLEKGGVLQNPHTLLRVGCLTTVHALLQTDGSFRSVKSAEWWNAEGQSPLEPKTVAASILMHSFPSLLSFCFYVVVIISVTFHLLFPCLVLLKCSGDFEPESREAPGSEEITGRRRALFSPLLTPTFQPVRFSAVAILLAGQWWAPLSLANVRRGDRPNNDRKTMTAAIVVTAGQDIL